MSVVSWSTSSRWQCTTAVVNCLLASWINVKERCEDFSKVCFLFSSQHSSIWALSSDLSKNNLSMWEETSILNLASCLGVFSLKMGGGKGEIVPSLQRGLMIIHCIQSLRKGSIFPQLPQGALVLCLQWGQWFYIILQFSTTKSWIRC